MPLLTVVTVVFNGVEQIARTIESVISQDYKRLEYIVIDGCSTDGTRDILRNYERNIDLIASEPDESVYDAMNKGARLASGEFILFMNCGDVFASQGAASAAMQSIQSGPIQIVFGNWIRVSRLGNEILCSPVLERGLFNHQAVIYSRSIHAWHGDYLNLPGLTTADYLFFVTLFSTSLVTCRVINVTLAIVDVNGMSAGVQTLSQKYAIDFLCGRTGRLKLIAVFALHPVYTKLKRLLRHRP